ncbi:PAS fold [Duganella sp. CF402]|uniref:PAS domain-containing sensor histidine kinase n=1 Tax=unclassified Duganella TaxID=2636909 RepID=UPI0008AB10A7|nr:MULTISPECIES: PAS domain S-box protein [unclassified Duganella]RZT11333.1 PAS/PAC sensor signal transduction histidine kinase [Duganella sp. BK701]SEK69834.1 PAS fold [Duganella sp. CF402]
MTIDFGTLILNEIPDAVVLTTTEGEVVCWTNGAQAVFGYSSAEAVGRHLDELIVPPTLHHDGAAVLRQTLADGMASYESMRRAKDGTLVYIDSSSKLVRDDEGRPAHILWSKKDVTALKVLRDAKLVAARYDGILDSMPDAIIMANAAGRIVLANHQAEQLFGYPRGALRGMVLEHLMPARFRTAHMAHRAGFAAQPQVRPMGSGRDLYGLRSDGAEFPVEISLSPIDTEDGPLAMSAIRDISERKRFEQALQEKNIELAKAVAAKDRFLTGMSHELRTPLNAIIGFTGTMLMKLPGPINDEQNKQLRMVQSSARQLLSLINDLLDLTRIESGKVELELAPLSCRALIDEVLSSFKPLARSKVLALEFDAGADEVTVCSDRRAVQQILMNLVHNAIKFTNNGAVMVRLARAVVGERACATISVSDTGIGIGAEQRDSLFQAFSQLDAAALRQFEGTGLGLHLSQKLAALLHGEILFDSEYGVGSVFTLALPLEA